MCKKQLDVELHFITKSQYSSLVSSNPYVDKLWTIEKEITEVVPKLRNENYDLVIDLHKNLRSKRLIHKLGVKSISFDKLNVQKWLRVHTPINRMPDYHLIDRYLMALESLGILDDGQGMDFFYQADAKKLLSDHKLESEKYLTIVLGATYLTKRVPDHIIEYILSNYRDYKIVLLGGKDVTDKANDFSQKFSKLINATGKLSLQESAALIDNSKLVISGDTGMMHIAAALKKPIISIWGGTHKDLGMYPYYGKAHPDKNIPIVNSDISCSPCSKIGKHSCPKGHFKCMLDLDPKVVLESILSVDS